MRYLILLIISSIFQINTQSPNFQSLVNQSGSQKNNRCQEICHYNVPLDLQETCCIILCNIDQRPSKMTDNYRLKEIPLQDIRNFFYLMDLEEEIALQSEECLQTCLLNIDPECKYQCISQFNQKMLNDNATEIKLKSQIQTSANLDYNQIRKMMLENQTQVKEICLDNCRKVCIELGYGINNSCYAYCQEIYCNGITKAIVLTKMPFSSLRTEIKGQTPEDHISTIYL